MGGGGGMVEWVVEVGWLSGDCTMTTLTCTYHVHNETMDPVLEERYLCHP